MTALLNPQGGDVSPYKFFSNIELSDWAKIHLKQFL